MKSYSPFLFLICLLAFPFFAFSQVLIAELAPSNTGQVQDEDNDNPDWLELFNAGTSDVFLGGYRLSDGGFGSGWSLPAQTLGAGERIFVFASGKNRGSANGSGVHHWETILNEGDDWRYFLGTTPPPSNWASMAFDAGSWPSGPGGFGYGDDDDATTVPTGTLSLYFRKVFSVNDPALLNSLALSIDYDDAFVAYLNGQEIARSNNISGTPTNTTLANADHEATLFAGGTPELFALDNELISGLLQAGNNVLAIEIHNVSDQSSDLSGRVWLHAGLATAQSLYGPNPSWFNPAGTSGQLHTDFKINLQEQLSLFNSAGVLLDSITAGSLQPGHSRMRLNDNGNWCVSNSPTPGYANGADCLSDYAAPPVFTQAPGFYNGSVMVGISGSGQIRYRTDGGIPDQNSNLYTGPFVLSSTTTLRARSFVPGKLPSAVSSASYFVDEPSTLPVVSICIPPEELDEVYYNYSRKGSVALSYFDKNRVEQFSGDFAGWVVGNWSTSFPQKSLQFVADEEYGSTGEIRYSLFAADKPIKEFHAFRIRNEDDDWIGARMRDRIVNELGQSTHVSAAAFQNVVAFINGEYWGHFNARERLDNYFVRDNYGADPDSVTMIKTHWGQDPYQAEYGSINDFYDLTDLITQNDMSNQANFLNVAEVLDLDNFTDYFATEIFVASTDWLQDYFNNVRLFKASKPKLKWKFLLWDVSYSSGTGSGYADADVLASTIANPFGSLYGDMFNSLLSNAGYRRFFINRFADLMNLNFQESRAHALINRSAQELAPEINRHHERWGTGDSLSWAYNVQVLKDFYSQRPAFQRQHIQNQFNLNGQVNITLQVNPPGAGHIKISTIIPENLPWTGVYFNGNPVTLTAIASPGYSFVNWQNSPFIANSSQATFTNNITNNTIFTANFSGNAQANPISISEINYNADPGLNAGDWLELRNNTGLPLDVSDFVVQDEEWYHRYVLPTGTLIPANGFFVLYENGTAFSSEYPAVTAKAGPLDFELGNGGDEVKVFNAFGQLLEEARYDDKKPWPCTPDGFGRTLERRPGSTAPPSNAEAWMDGCIGGSPGLPYSDCQENPLISELNYKSAANLDAGDWIEFFNSGSSAIDLSGWSLRDDNDSHIYTIPNGLILPAGSYFVFYENETSFFLQHPNVANATGPLGFGLNGDGDLVRLFDASGKIRFSLCYDDASPWEEAADGQGYTLENNFNTGNNNNPGNWFAGCLGGSPGAPYDPGCDPVALETIPELPPVQVFPNPASDEANLRLPQFGQYELKLMDAYGRCLWHQSVVAQECLVPLAGLNPGLYWLEITEADGKRHAHKLVKSAQ